MNPAIIELLKNLALTGAQVYAQSAGKDAGQILGLSNLALVVAQTFAQAASTLKRAQDEGWTDDDVRWVPIFAAGDAVLDEIEKRMV